MKRVIIVGGGFAGVKCAQVLRRGSDASHLEIVLFNRENHMVFDPLLAEVAGATIDPDAVISPLRYLLPGVQCRTEEVRALYPAENRIEFLSAENRVDSMTYDHIVIACGARVNLGIIPGMASHGFPLKTLGDALRLRYHLVQQLEKAETTTDVALRRHYLSFVVVGGGFSGVEIAGEINDLMNESLRYYPNIKKEDVRVVLVHSREEILPEISAGLRRFARDRMAKAGVQFVLNARVAAATVTGVVLQDGRSVDGATVVCTIGNAPAPLAFDSDFPKEHGRISTDPDMRVKGQSNIWAVGDAAFVLNAQDGEPSPTTGQFAERQGKQLARNLLRALNGEPTRPFTFRSLGQLCAIGGRRAVAEIMGLHMSGRLAWMAWRGVYLFKNPSWARRTKLGFDWAWQLFFARDIAYPRTDTSERVGKARYQPGDFIFRVGETATDFYVIEKGEVEVISDGFKEKPGEVLAVLTAGDFFGEMALLEDRPHRSAVRARTPVELVVIGRSAFSELSGSFTFLRQLLKRTIRRRSTDSLKSITEARRILDQRQLTDFMVPAKDTATLSVEDTMERALRFFSERSATYACIVDANGLLKGLLTRTVILQAIEGGARRETAIASFMIREPVTLTLHDTPAVAAATMREHELKGLPIVAAPNDHRLAGYLPAQSLVDFVLNNSMGN